ncbi:MAG: hypothetical protein R3F48_02175 [Candidatus Zixiibacteriota bacterium]
MRFSVRYSGHNQVTIVNKHIAETTDTPKTALLVGKIADSTTVKEIRGTLMEYRTPVRIGKRINSANIRITHGTGNGKGESF